MESTPIESTQTVTNTKSYRALFLVGIFCIVLATIGYYLYATQTPQPLESQEKPADVMAALGVRTSFELDMFCDTDNMPSFATEELLWHVVCETQAGQPYAGIYWKRPDLQKNSFQNRVINNFLKRATTDSTHPLTGKFSCKENTTLPDETKMRSVMVNCTVTVNTVATTTAYTTFIYSYPANSVILKAMPVIIVSSGNKDMTELRAQEIYKDLRPATAPTSALLLNLFIETAYSSGGPGGGGDGSGDGSGDASGDSGTGSVSGDVGSNGGIGSGPGDPGASGNGAAASPGGGSDWSGYSSPSCSSGWCPTTPTTPTPPTPTVTCNSYNYDNSSVSGNCTSTWTNTYNYCSDGTSWTDEGAVTTVCACTPTSTTDSGSYSDGCAVISWTATYTTNCDGTTSQSTAATRNESACRPPTCTNGYTNYPTCGPESQPVPNACDAADASLYCSTACCTTSSGDLKCGTRDCSTPTTPTTPPSGCGPGTLNDKCPATPVTPPVTPSTPTPPRPTTPAPLPSGCGPGTLNDDCYVPYPDLSVSSVTPARVTPDVSATFSATVSNVGDDTTGTWFYNFFQIATDVNGGGTVTDLPATSMNTLSPGRSGVASTAYTFSKGIYSIRACADKSNRSNSGRIGESNEGNNCGPWTRLVVKDPPEILNVNMEFPDITFVCINSESYTATHEESGEVIGQGPTVDGETILAKFSEEGNYSLRCLSDPLSARAVVNYTIPEIVLSGLSISANPRTVNNNKSTTLSWSVLNPRPVCSLRAETVCSDTCSADQLAASSSINTMLRNGTTDPNDQYGGGRNIQTAVQKVYTKYSNKALGKKTLPMNYTTDFVLDCGKSSIDGKSLIKKIRVMVSSENEG